MAEFLNSNVKHLRTSKNISQQSLADKIGVDRSTVSRIENGEIETTIDNAIKIADTLGVPLNDLVSKDLRFDNAVHVNLNEDANYIKIPVLGVIKAGIPIEAQQDILEYIDIPKSWTKGGKELFGLRISGDSMFPKYVENDTVVFEKNNDFQSANGKDCAVMVNGDDATFKKILINDDGITLIPYNTGTYELMMYSNKDIEEKPIRIIGFAKKIIKEV